MNVPIPVKLAHLPVHAGLVIPWITPVVAGRPVFGSVHQDRVEAALQRRLCQVCGQPMPGRRVVFLLRAVDLRLALAKEPALHGWCAAYTVTACPMVSGRLEHYRDTPRRDPLGIGIPLGSSSDPYGLRAGAAAEPWLWLWASGYTVVTDPHTRLPAARIEPAQQLKVRAISPAGTP